MFFSSRKRNGRVQPKGTQRSPAESSLLPTKKTFAALLGCFVVLCVAVGYKLDDGYWASLMGRADESDPKELDTAIDKAIGKERRELGSASRTLKLSFDAQPKDTRTGQVNARVAGHLLQNYFAADGWRVQGLTYQVMRPTSTKGLHDALSNVAVLKNLAPGVHSALQRRATSRGGFTLKQITGLAAVIKGKLLNEGHVTTVLRMLYRRSNLSFVSKIGQETLENITEAYISHLNVVDTYAESVSPAFQNWPAETELKDKALEHAYALATRSSGKPGAGANLTSPNYSYQVVSVMAENLSRAFERHYIADHCENIGRLLNQVTPKGTGRLRLSTFYSQAWNETLNFAEPKRHLRSAGALDESDTEPDSTRVLAANYLQGHLNCIRHSQYYSLCCPNVCTAIMQSIEASIKSPVASPQQILDAVANSSFPHVEAARQMPTALVARLHEIPERHGGVIPLQGRLFAQWLHYAFPNECRYPQEKDMEMKKVRLMAKEVSTPEKEEVAWATLNRGFDVPATRLYTMPWSENEVLPLQEEQVWASSSVEWRDILRAAVCLVVVVAMLRAIYTLACSSQVAEDGKPASDQSSKLEAFENQLKSRVELLRFEFNVELTPGKGQEQTRAGIEFRAAADSKDGLIVEDIQPGGLLHCRNETIAGSKRVKVLVGDRLLVVNGKTSPQEMMEELSMLSGKTSLRFSRESSRAAPLIWTAELERERDEPWGMALSEVAESQNSKELTVSRVVAGGPVEKWNRRAMKKNKNGIYPGDIIIGCNPEVDCKKVLTRLQKETSLQLTILRWQAATETKVQKKGNDKMDKSDSSATQNELDVAQNVDQPQDELVEEVAAAREEPQVEIEEHRCECCDAVITDKFVVMCCNAGEVKYYRRTCWRQKHGGFTMKHLPRRCTCGSPLAKVEVFERSSPSADPRLIHTILEGPLEVDVRMDEIPDQEDRQAGNAQRRGASAARRAIEGDARRRAASVGRRRSAHQDGSPERKLERDAEPEVDEPFFRPRRQREPNVLLASSRDQATSSSERPASSADAKEQHNSDQPSQTTKVEGSKPVISKQAVETSDKKMQSESFSRRSQVSHSSKACEEPSEVKTTKAATINADLNDTKQASAKSRNADTVKEMDPWFVGADPWEAGKVGNERKADLSIARHSSNASHVASTDAKEDPWFASEGADPWGTAKNKGNSSVKTQPSKKMMDNAVTTHAKKEEDPWLGSGTDPWEASKQKNDVKEDPWFAAPDADPWQAAQSSASSRRSDFSKAREHEEAPWMKSEGEAAAVRKRNARSSSGGFAPSAGDLNPLAAEFVPGGRSLPTLGLLLPPPPPPPPLEQPQPPQAVLFEPPPGLLEPTEPAPALLGPATETLQCLPPPGLSQPSHCSPPPGLPEPDQSSPPPGLPEPDQSSPPPGLPEPTHCSPPPGLAEPADFALSETVQAPFGLCSPPPGLADPIPSSFASVREIAAPPGLSLADAPPGLEAPEMSDGGSSLPPLPPPVGISAPPGLPEPDAPWPDMDDSATPRSQADGIDRNGMDERASAEAAKANKSNRWNKSRQDASE